jgi:chemotaxis response regulator CheB
MPSLFAPRTDLKCQDSMRPALSMVVEDFDSFRRLVSSKLEQRPELEVVCAVFDGLGAVQKAEELRPDPILLDIGLPTPNCIEAARPNSLLAPESKIVIRSHRKI